MLNFDIGSPRAKSCFMRIFSFDLMVDLFFTIVGKYRMMVECREILGALVLFKFLACKEQWQDVGCCGTHLEF